MMIAEDLLFLIPHGAAEITTLFPRSSGTGSIQGQTNEGTVVKGLVPLGLMNRGDRRLPCHRRVQSLREVSQGIVAETAGYAYGACPRSNQPLDGREGGTT